jgi:hypothetical protein
MTLASIWTSMAIVAGGGLLLVVARMVAWGEQPSRGVALLRTLLGVSFFASLAGLVVAHFASASFELQASLALFATAYVIGFVIPSPVTAQAWMRATSAAQTKRGRVVLATVIAGSFIGASLGYLKSLEADDLTSFGDSSNFSNDLHDQNGIAASETESPLYTDRGQKIAIRKMFTSGSLEPAVVERQTAMLQRFRLREQVIQIPAGWQPCNCHGFTFSDGQYWIPGEEVPKILKDNGYVPMHAPKPGDVAVYRNSADEVMHTGIVHSVNADLILVESKWGRMGRFIHPHNRHCYLETTCTFYRSRRAGNTVQGVPPHDGSLFPDLPDAAMLHHMMPTQLISHQK